jgi:ubiquinone/menaquinone biosynthesis C-methylase UbiE
MPIRIIERGQFRGWGAEKMLDRSGKIWLQMIDELMDEVPRGHILDVGCGRGGMIKYLQKRGEIIGLDISLESLQRASKHGQTVLGNARFLPFYDGQFDVVISRFVLHHIENYREALSEIHRCLKTNGYLVLIESVENNLLFRLGRTLFRRRDGLPILSRYTYQEFVETLHKVNFTPVREKRFYIGTGLVPTYLGLSSLIPLTDRMDEMIESMIGTKYCLTYACVARRS